jgi:hypothetical protein
MKREGQHPVYWYECDGGCKSTTEYCTSPFLAQQDGERHGWEWNAANDKHYCPACWKKLWAE